MILHTLAVGTVPAAPLQHAQHDTWYMIHGDLALAAFKGKDAQPVRRDNPRQG